MMKQEVIEVDGMKISMSELKLKTTRKLVSNFVDYFMGTKDVDIKSMIDTNYDLLLEISKDFIEMPEGKSLEDLGYGTIKTELFPAFKRLNQDFLDDVIGKVASMIPLTDQENQPQIPESSLENSTKPLQD